MGDTEAVQLAALVDSLAVRLSEQTALTAMWAERCRVLGEQHMLCAPESPVASNLTRQPTNPSLASRTGSWRGVVQQLGWLALAVLAAVLGAGILLLVPR